MFELTDYATLVQKATIVESGGDQIQKKREDKKRKAVSQGGGPMGGNFPSKFNRGAVSQPARSAGFKRIESRSVGQRGRQSGASFYSQPRPPLPDCKLCGRKHLGACNQSPNPNSLSCYKCGKPCHYANKCISTMCYKCGHAGHMQKDCKVARPISTGVSGTASNKPPTARTYNMTMQDAVRKEDVIAGTLFLNSVNANVLFDSGATKSFISRNFACKLNLKAEPLMERLLVEIANQEVIPVSQIHPNCNLEIEGIHFQVD